MKVIPYASVIGSIMYAMLYARPDVCLAISLAGRYESNPGVDHWTTVKNILKYLKRTKDMLLIYGLVQAYRSWNIRFGRVIKAYGFYTNFCRSMYLQESEWDLCSIFDIICGRHIVNSK